MEGQFRSPTKRHSQTQPNAGAFTYRIDEIDELVRLTLNELAIDEQRDSGLEGTIKCRSLATRGIMGTETGSTRNLPGSEFLGMLTGEVRDTSGGRFPSGGEKQGTKIWSGIGRTTLWACLALREVWMERPVVLGAD